MRRASRRSLASAKRQTSEPVSPYSQHGEAKRDALFEIIDELPLWQAELVWEYGADRTLRAVRHHPTPTQARRALEQERQMNEVLRWHNNGHLPRGY